MELGGSTILVTGGAGLIGSHIDTASMLARNALDYIILRYIGTYGPRQNFRGNFVLFIPECFDRIERGLPPVIYGDGSQPYDYIYVEDVARANVLALKSAVTGEVINIGTGVPTTVKDVVRLIGEVTGTTLAPGYFPQSDRFRQQSLWPDVEKAKKLLGFQAEFNMREGLQKYYEWQCKSKQI